MTAVQLVDVLGRILYDNTNIDTKQLDINNINASNQALILKVTFIDGTITVKKISK